jgi:DNA-binding response OmpR family regulator
MRILIVEDNPTERDLLKYLLEGRFHTEAKFREANSLETACRYLDGRNIDCVILDLQLPDSVGKDTFVRLNDRYPEVPIIVMTHNKDRELAIEMIRAGAADYILKDYTNEEELFRRVMFAIEKHQRTIRTTPDKVASIQALDQAKASLASARQSGKPEALQEATTATTAAMADLTKGLVAGLQDVSLRLKSKNERDDQTYKILDSLKSELLGSSEKLSVRSQLEVLEERLRKVEEVSASKPTNKKLVDWLRILGLVGTILVLF